MKVYPPKEVKEALGAICVNSSSVEVTLRTMIWHVAGISAEVGMALTGGKSSIQDLTDMLSTMLKQQYPELLEKVSPHLRQLRSLNDSRGKYVHGIWSPGNAGGMMVGKPFMKRDHDKGVFEAVTLNQLNEIALGYEIVESNLSREVLDFLPPPPSPS